MMQTWDAWGGAWGNSWGFSWGFSEQVQGGGGSGKTQKKRGWANERAALEQSLTLRQAQTVLREVKKPEAVKLAQKINAYEVGNIDLESLRIENAQLQARLQVKEEYQAEMQAAQQAIQTYIEDEQDAIDALMLSVEMDSDIILNTMVQQ
jgi:ABC-type phosphate transport system auxiliary subunit